MNKNKTSALIVLISLAFLVACGVTQSGGGGGGGGGGSSGGNTLKYVAVGYEQIKTSTDGSTWIDASTNFSGYNLQDVAYGNGTFVAVGGSGLIAISTDNATNWSDESEGSSNWYGIAYGNGTFVAVGVGGRITRSTDGQTWIDETEAVADLYDITYANGWFVAVGVGGTTLRSSDGQTWTRTFAGSNYFNDIAYGNGNFVAVGYRDMYISTDNAVTWVDLSRPAGTTTLTSITYGNDKFIAVNGAGGTIFTSTDNAVTWCSDTSLSGKDLNNITYAGGQFVIVGSSTTTTLNSCGIYTSTSGSSWSSITPSGSILYGVTARS